MPSEPNHQPREYSELAVRKFIAMIDEDIQEELSIKPGEEADVVESIIGLYRLHPPEDEKYADTKADAALDMLSGPLLMSPRKRNQIVRGYAHSIIESRLRQDDDAPVDMGSLDNQSLVDALTVSLRPQMILGQIARRYSAIQTADNIEDRYESESLREVTDSFHNFIIDLVDDGLITKPNAVGILLLFGNENYSRDIMVKRRQAQAVVEIKSLLGEMLKSQSITPSFERIRRMAAFETREEKSISEKLNSVYADYLMRDKITIEEARRRFLIDSQRALSTLFYRNQ